MILPLSDCIVLDVKESVFVCSVKLVWSDELDCSDVFVCCDEMVVTVLIESSDLVSKNEHYVFLTTTSCISFFLFYLELQKLKFT